MPAPTGLVVRAHAKINLDLRICGRRNDGYHELRTVFQTLAWHDTVTVSRVKGPLEIAGDASKMPLDRSNLAWRAAEALWHAAGPRREPSGTRIAIVKRIPAQAGLGGGSSDAAATLVALNRLWNFDLTRSDLASLARPLGADVAYFLTGGTALGLGRGDEIYPLADLPRQHVVVGWSGRGVATTDAYRWMAEWYAAKRSVIWPIRTFPGWAPESPASWTNDLQAPVEEHRPEIRRIRRTLEAAGASLARMSGSGAAVFGFFDSKDKAVRAKTLLESKSWQAVLTRSLARGPQLV
jgi:4-diphosphocytidyl-2-C-methyl-D-erythritol kinase